VPIPVRARFNSSIGHLPSARTSIGIAAMEIISSTGTCQVPVPVLAWLFAAQTNEFYCSLEKLR
jgi:hypothetical protein